MLITNNSNSSTHVDFLGENSLEQRQYFRYVEGTILLLFFILGAPLNAQVFVKLHESHVSVGSNARRALLLKQHLNFSDLMIIFVFITYKLCLLVVSYQWNGGSLLCKLVNFLNVVAFQVSSNIIATIAIDRWLQARNCSSYGRVRLMLYSAWLIALVLASPQLFVWDSISYPGGQTRCTNVWSRYSSTNGSFISVIEDVYNISHVVTVFWVPLAIILVCYAHIVAIVAFKFNLRSSIASNLITGAYSRSSFSPPSFDTQSRKVQLQQRHSSLQLEAEQRRRSTIKSKTCGISGLLIVVFVLCWAPYNLAASMSLLENFDDQHHIMMYLYHLIAFNSVINPWIYGGFQCHDCSKQ